MCWDIYHQLLIEYRFRYSFAIDGLSASGLRIILQPVNKDGRPDGYLRVLWGTKDPTNDMWMKSEVLYTYNKDHQVSNNLHPLDPWTTILQEEHGTQ